MKILILFFLISFAYLPPNHAANSTMRCLIGPKSVKGTLKRAAAVFTGEVLEIKTGSNFVEARFQVECSWKGVEAEEVYVIAENTAESPHYRVGEEYLVFAGIQNGKLFTGNCSRTKKVEYALEDLRQLGKGRASASLDLKSAPKPLDLTGASDSELQRHLGKIVIMRGRFSLNGKVGPFIIVGERPIYVVSDGSFSWGQPYARMEGREVRVTGTLRFFRDPERPRQDQAPTKEHEREGRLPDHFYFEAQTAKVELIEK